jgi:hypothetical protein
MTTLTWAEQYRHPKWQMRRLERMKAANATCERCGETDLTLNVHHKRYVKGRMVWEYSDAELECLCEPCHEEQTHLDRDMREMLMHVDKARALALIAGFNAGFTPTTEGFRDLLNRIEAENPFDVRLGALAYVCMTLRIGEFRTVARLVIDRVRSRDPNTANEWDEIADKLLGPEEPPG